ncbi:MAG: hypothetical protein WBO36_15195, partial [Saprospiraceae bacterium]
MKNSMYHPCHTLALRYYFRIVALVIFGFTSQMLSAQCVASDGVIDGFIYHDTNNDGVRNISEIGIPNLLVLAQDS